MAKKPCGKLTIEVQSGPEKTMSVLDDVDTLLWAIGRLPNTEIALDKVVSTGR